MSISFGSILICFFTIAFLYMFFQLILITKIPISPNEIRIIIYGVILLCIRILIPLNFPFTATIRTDSFLLKVSDFLLLTEICGVSLINVFITLWIIGAVINITRFAKKIYDSSRLIRQAAELRSSNKEDICKILNEYDIKTIKVAVFDEAVSPAISGILKPILIFPNYSYSESDLRFIIAHEVGHLKRHDLIIKYILEVCKCIYWWNPIMYLFVDRFLLAIEIANDISITKSYNNDDRIEYAKCLIKNFKLCKQNKSLNNSIGFVSIPFVINNKLNIRLMKLLERSNTIKTVFFRMLRICIFSCLMLIGIVIVPEAYQVSTSVQETTFTISPDNAYLIKTASGYELYVNNKYITTISNIDESLQSLKIYKE